jgi:hypothetical protein
MSTFRLSVVSVLPSFNHYFNYHFIAAILNIYLKYIVYTDHVSELVWDLWYARFRSHPVYERDKSK